MLRVSAEKFKQDIARIERRLNGAADIALKNAATRLAANVIEEADDSMKNSPPDRTRPRGKGRGYASSPGNAPRPDTGFLRRSARLQPRHNGADAIWSSLYAVFLEFGTRKMAPRPFVRPALMSEKAEAARDALNKLREEYFRRGGGRR